MSTLDSRKAASNDIKYYQNDVFDMSIEVTDQDGIAVNLSSKTLKFQVKKKKIDAEADAVVDISTDSEISISGASNNIVTFSGTYDLPQRSYYYDLENTTDNETIMYGRFIVTGDVVR